MLGKLRSFFRRNKPVYIDCYTTHGFIYEHAQPRPAKEFTPKWLKDIPVKLPVDGDGLSEGKTIRMCSGLNQLLDSGFIIPMWCDFKVKLGDKTHTHYKWLMSAEQLQASLHPAEQRGSYLPETEYSHVKLDNYWNFQCDEPIKFAMIDNTWMWDKPDDVIIPAGVIDFHYQHGAHVNIFFKRGDEDKEIFIKHGQPLVQLVPLTERPVVFRYHLLTEPEMRKINSLSGIIKFIGSEYHKRKNPKYCPYSTAKELFKK